MTINNVPSGQETKPNQLDARLEEDFVASGVSFLPGVTLHRQLPVGLFRDEVLAANNVFTGGKAAIDLWGIDGDTFHVIELKAGNNKKMGALSEMFFYANYVYDVFCGGRFGGEMFSLNQQLGDDAVARGYGKILSSSPTKVLAHIFIEEGMCHPALESTLSNLSGYKHENVGFDSEVHTYSAHI